MPVLYFLFPSFITRPLLLPSLAKPLTCLLFSFLTLRPLDDPPLPFSHYARVDPSFSLSYYALISPLFPVIMLSFPTLRPWVAHYFQPHATPLG